MMKDLSKVTNENGVITALAIDQRNSLKKMLGTLGTTEHVSRFKEIVSEQLSKEASAILLDPEYGLSAASVRDDSCAAIFSYEVSGYQKDKTGRLPTILEGWTVEKLKNNGADAIKLLVYYDPDEDDTINRFKKTFIKDVGTECKESGLPFFLEIITYDHTIEDMSSKAYAVKRPQKINDSMREFSTPTYHVDVLKIEVPVNMHFVEGFSDDYVYTKEEARAFFKAQNDSTTLPFIFLSGGVPTDLFLDTLSFAHEASSNFSGILGGRAIWKESIQIYIQHGEDKTSEWMRETGMKNILDIMTLVNNTARPIK